MAAGSLWARKQPFSKNQYSWPQTRIFAFESTFWYKAQTEWAQYRRQDIVLNFIPIFMPDKGCNMSRTFSIISQMLLAEIVP